MTVYVDRLSASSLGYCRGCVGVGVGVSRACLASMTADVKIGSRKWANVGILNARTAAYDLRREESIVKAER